MERFDVPTKFDLWTPGFYKISYKLGDVGVNLDFIELNYKAYRQFSALKTGINLIRTIGVIDTEFNEIFLNNNILYDRRLMLITISKLYICDGYVFLLTDELIDKLKFSGTLRK